MENKELKIAKKELKAVESKHAEGTHTHADGTVHNADHSPANVNKQEAKSESKPVEEVKKEDKKPVKITKKEEAVASGISIHASKRHCMYICDFIKGKKIDEAIADLESVIKFKRAIPFKGEIPHRKGKGMMSGRYPVNASKIFISMLKGLKGNVSVNGLDLDKTRIYYGSASWSSRPQKASGGKLKRANVIIKAKEFKK